MKFREYVPGEEFIAFFSNAKEPYNKLSNFSMVPEGISVFKRKFISSEHAFQSRKYIKEDAERFTIDGDLGNVDGFDLVNAKESYWMKKSNIGVVAKMATSSKNEKKLGLRRNEDFESSWKLWKKILKKKFKNEEFKKILLSTGDKYLLEFSRDAKNRENYWGGLIENGVLYGENMMGKYLMKIRDKLSKE